MPKCLVHGCLSRWGRKNEEYMLHSFPNDPDMAKSWLSQMGYSEPEIKALIPNIMEFQRRGRYRMCSKHFAKDCYEQRGSSWFLKKGAIPTLFLSLDTLSAGNNEHSYARQFTEIEDIQSNTSISNEHPYNLGALSKKKQFSRSVDKCTNEIWSVNSEGELVKTKIRSTSIVSSDSEGTAQKSSSDLQGTAQTSSSDLQGTAQTSSSDLQGTTQKSSSDLQGTTQKSSSDLQGTAQKSSSDLQGTAQKSSSDLQGTAQKSSSDLQGTAQKSSSDLKGTTQKSSRNYRTKPNFRSVATCTEYFPGQRHKSTQFEKHFGCKEKKIQVFRRPLHRSIAIQCNMDETSRSTRSRKPQLAFDKEQEYTREDQNMETSNMSDDLQFQEADKIPGQIEGELSPMSADLEESGSRDDLSNSDTYETPQKKKKDRSCNPAREEQFLKGMDINDEIFVDPKDLDNSFLLLPESKQSNPVTEKKFIVFESCLDELLMSSHCKGMLGCTGSIVRIKKYRVGSAIAVMGFCSQGHRFHLWKSQPLIGKIPVGNLLLSAGVFCSGSNFAKVESMFEFIGLYGIDKSTYDNNQKKYLFPTINYHWRQNRQQILDKLGTAPVALSGGGRFDSPGHKAKYCMYSFLEHKSKKIIDFQIEQVKSGIDSVSLETKAFEIGLERILSSHVNVKILCTDRHVSIPKKMKRKHPDIVHQFDVWHLVESVGNKIAAASKRPNASVLAQWVTPAKNHLWWSAKTCNLDPGLLKEQWSSIIYHVCNKHRWENGGRYMQCHHPPLTAEQEPQKEWLVLGSPAHTKLLEIVLDPRLLKDIGKLSHFCHTGELEVFHRTSLKYRPKRNCFLIDEMVARTQLAALDHNYNTGRSQAILKETSSTTDDSEKLRHRCSFKKSEHRWVVESIFEKTNQTFVLNIIHDTIELACGKKKC